ncbi:MAG: tetratricopeptide repeat protein [Luteolibacter sp.]
MKKLVLAAFALFTISLALPAQAQEEDIGQLVDKGLAAMNEAKWQEGVAVHTEIVKRFGDEDAMGKFGPKFGVLVYRKGICELKLKQYAEAMKSFDSCYKDYPNTPEKGGNTFQKMALLKWGEAALGAKQYQVAIDQWKKFLAERNKAKDKYAQGTFHVNLAVCYYNLGKMTEGNQHLQIAIANKTTFPTPPEAIISGFQGLVTAAINANDEQVIADFIAKNRGNIIVDPYVMHRFSDGFLKLAGDAIGKKMNKTALSLYQFIPSSEVAISDLRSRINAMGNVGRVTDGQNRLDKKALQKQLKDLEAKARGSKSSEIIRLAGTAYIEETLGNVYAAHGAYLLLERYHKKAEKREDNLYHLFRTASIIGDDAKVLEYGDSLRKLFPESEHIPDVQKLLLSSLFFDGEYESVIKLASNLIDGQKVKEGTDEHDIALFMLGGAHFYMGHFNDAQPLIEQHIKTYPESQYHMSAEYILASNAIRLQMWSKAAKLLDEFLSKYNDSPDQTYIPLALYDRANTHYSEEESESALGKVDRIIAEFPDAAVVDQAYNLKGNVLQGNEDREEAEAAYLKALEIAEDRSNAGTAGEALTYLVGLLGEEIEGDDSRMKDAVKYADRYWEEFSQGSPFRSSVAVSGLPAYEAVGRGDEGLQRLQKVISDMAKMTVAPGLEEAINSYTEAYLKNHTPEQLKDHYYSFPGVGINDKAARAILRIAIIGVFQDVAKNDEKKQKKRAANAMTQVLFQELKTDFELKDLSNYILVKLGDYLRLNTSAPREALPFYDEALSRDDQSYRFGALSGRADVYGNSDSKADLDKALQDFEVIFKDSEDKGEREFALYRIIEILMKKGDYGKAAERANQYLNRDKGQSLGFNKYSAEVGLILADSFKDRKKIDDAIAMYVKVWSTHMGNIKISAPAVKSWMELSYQRNRNSADDSVVSDRQGAYNGGWRYINLTSRFKDKFQNIPAEFNVWKEVEALVNKYEADANVKSMKQMEKEKNEK